MADRKIWFKVCFQRIYTVYTVGKNTKPIHLVLYGDVCKFIKVNDSHSFQ